jgi:hypothetical protein
MSWMGHTDLVGEMGIVYNILDGIFEGKRPLGRTTSGWDKKNIKMYLH